MFEMLENLRAQPEKTRKRVAFLVALSVAVLLLAVWGTVILPDFNQDQAVQVRAASETSTPSPLSTFGNAFKDGVSSISQQFGELKTTVTHAVEPATVYYSSTSTVGNGN